MKHLNLVVLGLTMASVTANAQKFPSAEDIHLADSLKTVLDLEPYEPVVALESKISYRFFPINGEMQAKETKEELLLSLQDDYPYSISVAGNNNTEIRSVNYFKGRKSNSLQPVEKECFSNFSEDIFDSDLKVCSYATTLDYKGQVQRFKSSVQIQDLKYLTSVYLSDGYPIMKRTVEFVVPNTLKVEFKKMNFEAYNVQASEEVVGTSTIYRFTVERINAHKDASWTQGVSYYSPHVIPIFKSYTGAKGEEPIFGSVQDQYDWYKKLVDEVDNKPETFKAQVEKILAGKTSDEEKISAIFYWVQDNIRYIAFERGIMGFRPEPAYKVYNKRFGDCKGMANLTKEMLIQAGFDARLAWIGTNIKSDQYDYSFPSLSTDNHMICVLMKDGKPRFLDATESYVAYGDCAARIQGRKVMVENGAEYQLVDVPKDAASANRITTRTSLSIDGKTLKGKRHLLYQGEAKRNILQQYHNTRLERKDEALQYFLRDGNKNMTLGSYESSDLDNRNNDLTFAYDFDQINQIQRFDQKIFVPMDLDRDFERWELSDEREAGYDLYHNRDIKNVTELTIPAGYRVASTPENFEAEHDLFKISMTFKEEGGKLIYEKQLTINERFVPLAEVSNWNDALEQVLKSYNEYVVLEEVK